jgi:hypothetical protein
MWHIRTTELAWDDVERLYILMVDTRENQVVTSDSFMGKCYGAMWPSYGFPRGTPPSISM